MPEDYLGVVTQLMALRKGRMEQMVNHGTGWVRLEYLVPARGLIGFRTEFLTETRGSGVMHSVFERYEPWMGEIKHAPDRLARRRPQRARPAASRSIKMQERGQLFVGPGEQVYEGMVVGDNARAEDLDVNAVREKKQTNVRAAGSDDTVQPRARAPPVARPGARVHPPGRVRRGDARRRAAAQGRAAGGRSPAHGALREVGLAARGPDPPAPPASMSG